MKKIFTFLMCALAALATASAGESRPQPEPIATDLVFAAPHNAPARTAANNEAGYTQWESLGTATVTGGISHIEPTLNSWRYEWDPEINIVNTTEVMTRHLEADPTAVQFLFRAFLGYNDLIADYNASTGAITAPRTSSGIPVISALFEQFGTQSLDLGLQPGTYSPARKIFSIPNMFLYVDEISGWNLGSVTITLPDARPEIGFYYAIKSGGMKSTDRSVTLAVDRIEVDHIRYQISHNDIFNISKVYAIATGTAPYETATDEVTIEYSNGYGNYCILALAYDADDKYMGIYSYQTIFSNFAPEGEWERVGKAVWHHPYGSTYGYIDPSTNMIHYGEFSQDALSWEVDLERRTDTSRSIYRIVNPYSPTCGIADAFNSALDLRYQGENAQYRPEAFNTSDTYYFVFDITDLPGEGFMYEEERPNGVDNYDFMSATFYGFAKEGATFIDDRLTIPYTADNSLVIDFPGYRGLGFQSEGIVNGNVVYSSEAAEIRYAIYPASAGRPSAEVFAEEAARIAAGTSQLNVHTVATGSSNRLPYAEYISEPSWMLVVPVDAKGVPFAHRVEALPHIEEYAGATLEECLINPILANPIEPTMCTIKLSKAVWPDSPATETYTFPNPYSNYHPQWMDKYSFTAPVAVADWTFIHDPATGLCNFVGTTSSGIACLDLGYGETAYMIPEFNEGHHDNGVFTFPYNRLFLEGINGWFVSDPETNRFIIRLNAADSGIDTPAISPADTNADAATEYYDLSGRRVMNPSSGIYIRRSGTTVEKIAIH